MTDVWLVDLTPVQWFAFIAGSVVAGFAIGFLEIKDDRVRIALCIAVAFLWIFLLRVAA